MASHEGRGSPSDASHNVDRDFADDRSVHGLSESESGSSYAGTASAQTSPVCPFRNSEFHDQECSLFFDCPSHRVHRAPADDDSVNHESTGPHRVSPDANLETTGHPRTDEATRSPLEIEDSLAGPTGHSNIEGAVAIRSSLSRPRSHTSQEPAVPGPTNADGVLPATLSASASPEIGSTTTALRHNQTSLPAPGRLATRNPGSTTSSRRSSASSRSNLQLNEPVVQSSGLPPVAAMITQRRANSRSGLDVAPPRWQPDSEVTSCPICHTDFSFLNRRHHCRKCGRVVCSSCSPHRIVIPNQYIVRAPGEMPIRAQSMYGEEHGVADFSLFLGGGQRVRLCNPCVPDPNMTPPQPQLSPSYPYPSSRSGHLRSRSSVVPGIGYFSYGHPGMQSPPTSGTVAPIGSTTSRSRSATINYLPPQSGLQVPAEFSRSVRVRQPNNYNHGPFGFMHPGNNSLGSASEAGSLPAGAYYSDSASQFPRSAGRQILESRNFPGPFSSRDGQIRFDNQVSGPSMTASARRNSRPLPPPPQIPEEDQCPVCHDELPSRSLPDFESLREQHIASCIEEYSRNKPLTARQSNSPDYPYVRPTGLVSYIATEKDRDSDEECAICFDTYEPGVKMARLECWCRFHYSCIAEWFQHRGVGSCPTHQHNSFGP